MSRITKEEWLDWKQQDITKAFYAACDIRAEDAKEILAGTAGLDSDSDNFYRGFIAAYSEMTGFTIEDMEDD